MASLILLDVENHKTNKKLEAPSNIEITKKKHFVFLPFVILCGRKFGNILNDGSELH